jgi:hypothetical protein
MHCGDACRSRACRRGRHSAASSRSCDARLLPPQAICRPADRYTRCRPIHAIRGSGCCKKVRSFPRDRPQLQNPCPPNSQWLPMTIRRQFPTASNHSRHHSASPASMAPVTVLAADTLPIALSGNSSTASLLQYTVICHYCMAMTWYWRRPVPIVFQQH